MTLLAPAWLALLLLAVPIVLLHTRRRRSITVASLLLWKGISNRHQALRTWRKPPLSAALLLQLLALTLLALILAQPVYTRDDSHLIVLLDATGGPSREAAFQETLAQVEQLASGHTLRSLILVTEKPRWIAARWPAGTPLQAGDHARALSGDPDWAAAAKQAEALTRNSEDTRIVLFGDARAKQFAAGWQPPYAGEVTVRTVTGPERPLRPLLQVEAGGSGRWRVTGRLNDTTTETASLSAVFRPLTDGLLLPDTISETFSLEVQLEPGGEAEHDRVFTVELELPGSGVLTLGLTPAGASSTSKTVFVLHEQPPVLLVLDTGAASPRLLHALSAVPGVRLHQGSTWSGDGEPDLVISAGPAESPLETSRLVLGAAGAQSPAAPSGWLSGHQLADGVQWSELRLTTAASTTRTPGSSVLLDGEQGPLLQARSTIRGREVLLAFNPETSNWPHLDSFPLFIRNLLRWIEPAAGRQVEAACQVGRECPLPVLSGTSEMLDPTGRAIPLARFAADGIDYGADQFIPEIAGLHLFVTPIGFRPLAVNAAPAPAIPAATARPAVAAAESPSLSPHSTLLAALLLVLGIEGWFAYRRPARKKLPLALRFSLLLIITFALVGLQLPLPRHAGQLVIILPEQHGSGEIAGLEEAAAELLGQSGPHRRISLVRAGSAATLPGSDLAVRPPEGVDLAAALQLGAALQPPGLPGRIVLAGDGTQTRNDFLGTLARLQKQVDTLAAKPTQGEEVVQLQALVPPAVVLAGERFTLDALLHSGSAQQVGLRVLRDGREVAFQEVSLRVGSNRISLEFTETTSTSVLYEAEVTGASGPGEAGRAAVTITVGPPPRVLLISGQPARDRILADALRLQGAEVRIGTAAELPGELGDLLAFHAIMLSGVPALTLGGERQELMEAFVRDSGRTLFLLGGEGTFGPGGYYDTPLERLSPASSLVPRRAPDTAIAFVLDRSNSMRQYAGDTVRLDIAKTATLRALELLPPETRVALIVFDSDARTLVPLRAERDDAELIETVLQLEPRGGTSLHPGLVEAYEQLLGSGAAVSHVIVMSDGLSQPGDFPGILQQLTAAGSTVSTIAIGPEADFEQLADIARQGGGAFHASRDFAALPAIMAQEVLQLDDDLIEERTVTPDWTESGATFLPDWPTRLPPVDGYVRTSVKPGADVHLTVNTTFDEQAPLLSSWRYGAGQVVAFTAQAAGPWTRAWLELPDYPLLWSQLLRQSLLPAQQPGLNLRAVRRGDVLHVTLEVLDELEALHGEVQPQVQLTGAAGETVLHLHTVEPGRHEGSVIPPGPGSYRLEAQAGTDRAVLPVHIAWPAALDRSLAEPALLHAASQLTGGQALASPAALHELRVKAWHWQRQPAWAWLCALAAALLLLELTARYAPQLLFRRI